MGILVMLTFATRGPHLGPSETSREACEEKGGKDEEKGRGWEALYIGEQASRGPQGPRRCQHETSAPIHHRDTGEVPPLSRCAHRRGVHAPLLSKGSQRPDSSLFESLLLDAAMWNRQMRQRQPSGWKPHRVDSKAPSRRHRRLALRSAAQSYMMPFCDKGDLM